MYANKRYLNQPKSASVEMHPDCCRKICAFYYIRENLIYSYTVMPFIMKFCSIGSIAYLQ
jgi:hypothetical protein